MLAIKQITFRTYPMVPFSFISETSEHNIYHLLTQPTIKNWSYIVLFQHDVSFQTYNTVQGKVYTNPFLAEVKE